MDDRSLARAIVAGDHDAFRVLADREAASVFHTCFRILRRSADAEDAAQEAFVIAYRTIGTYRGDGSLGAWLSRIAARHALRRLAHRLEAEPLDGETYVRWLVGGPDPAREALAAERGGLIRSAVAALPDPYGETIALRFFAELSLAEIAATTGRPLGTVKTHLHRGLVRLRAVLAHEAVA